MSEATFLPAYLETLDTTPLDVVPMLAPSFSFSVLWNDPDGAKEFAGGFDEFHGYLAQRAGGRPAPPRRRLVAHGLARGRARPHDPPWRDPRHLHDGRPGGRRRQGRAPLRRPHDLTPAVMAELTHTDLLVLGGGMAGLSAAAWSVREGRSVDARREGRARRHAPSTPASSGRRRRTRRCARPIPDGDPALARTLADGFAPAIEWVRSLGVECLPAVTVLRFGRGHQTDITNYLRAVRG